MDRETLWRKFDALPPEGQQEVVDFITFLLARFGRRRPTKPPVRTPLAEEPFIGIWRDRADMEDSTAWVRAARAREWGGEERGVDTGR
jgi:hypothetical protein